MNKSICLLLCLLAFYRSNAQLPLLQTIPLPMESPKAVTRQTIGLARIEIEYSRPAVKQREIWGKLVPYNNGIPYPWRAGANENTVISFSENVKIEGKEIPAGKYGLHMIPGPDTCTIIFSKNTGIWGSFSYRPSEDFARVKVLAKPADMHEFLTYDFDNITDSSAEMYLAWEKRKIPFLIEVDTKKMMLDQIHNSLRNISGFSWQGWNSAAEYCMLNNYNLPEALSWAQRSIAIDDNFVNNKTKSEILRKSGKDLQADSAWQKALQVASFPDLNRNLSIALAMKNWNQAVEIFQSAEKRYPPTFGIYYNGAMLYKNMNDKPKATDYFNKALSLARNDNEKKRVADQLKLLN